MFALLSLLSSLLWFGFVMTSLILKIPRDVSISSEMMTSYVKITLLFCEVAAERWRWCGEEEEEKEGEEGEEVGEGGGLREGEEGGEVEVIL